MFLMGSISFAFVNCAFSHEENHAENQEWNPISAGPLTTWTAPLCGKGKFVVQPFFFYNRTRGTFDSDGHYDSLPKGDKKYQYQQQLFMQYGLTEKFEVDGQVVYQENYIKRGDLKAHSNGLGDSYLFLRYCAIEEERCMPNVAALLQLKFPTGKYEHADSGKLDTDLMGNGSYDQGLGLILTKKLRPFMLHMDTIYSFSQKIKVDGVKTQYAPYLNYDFGMEYFLPKGFNLILEFNGFLQSDKKEDENKIPASDISYLTVAPGIGWSNDKIQILLAYQRILTGTNTDANDSAVFTFVYTF